MPKIVETSIIQLKIRGQESSVAVVSGKKKKRKKKEVVSAKMEYTRKGKAGYHW